jgi:hypothetical protein
MNEDYGELFREAYSLLHGGGPNEVDSGSERRAGEAIEVYLARSRNEALSATQRRLASGVPPQVLANAHQLLLSLIENSLRADEALAHQVESYQCGNFHESVRHSDRLQELVVESQRLDRELIAELRNLPVAIRNEVGIGISD